jgi:hypothetical protein
MARGRNNKDPQRADDDKFATDGHMQYSYNTQLAFPMLLEVACEKYLVMLIT